jgi:hypothetical protein
MRIVIFLIMEYDGNQNSVSDLQIAVVTQRIDEFTRTMVVMPDFFVTVDERLVTSRDTTVPDRNVAVLLVSTVTCRHLIS